MKKLNLIFISALVLLVLINAKAEETLEKVSMKEANLVEFSDAKKAEIHLAEIKAINIIENMETRLLEINSMDFSELNFAEKRELRKEVRTIKRDMDALAKGDALAKAQGEAISGSGIYISTGALIVILLLILIL